ncbi:hypothetical protein GQ600_18348 [Phytophthora cactorum]|nr:hypothetical protein GQ600_18348 [Phytophthora cactorum]
MTGYSQLKQAMREQLVVNAGVMIREHFRKRLRAKKLVGQIMYACYNVEETDMLEALQMRDVLTPDGEEWSEKWIPWPDNIKKNGMEFYIRLIWSSRASWRIEWRLFQTRRGPFKVMRWTVMRRAFAIDRYETRKEECPLSKTEFLQLPVEEKYEHASHLFANEIKSDGYSASVLYYRPKHEELGGEDDSLVPEGAREYLRLQAPRRRSRRKVRRPRRKNRKKVDPSVNCGENAIPKVDTPCKACAPSQQPRHRQRDHARVQASGRVQPLPRLERESEEEVPGLQERDRRNAVVQDLELREVPEAAGLLLAARGVPAEVLSGAAVPEVALLPEENGSRCKVDEIARRIVPTGHAPSPVKGLKEALRKRAMVVSMDEFRTSKLCSQCYQSLSSVQYPTPVFPKGVQKPKRRKMKGKVLPRDWSRAEIKSKHCHVVLRCENEDCEARYWDRDVNAAFNMLELLKSEVQGRGRMEPFRRA